MALIQLRDLGQNEDDDPAETAPPTVPTLRTRSRPTTLVSPDNLRLKTALPAVLLGHDYDLVSRGQWSLHQLIAHLVDLLGPCACTLTSWGISAKPLTCLLDLVRNQRIRHLNALFDHRVRLQCPDAFQLLLSISEHERVKVGLSKIHAKVVILHGEHLAAQVSTSANLTVNPRTETYALSTSPEKVAFHSQWVEADLLTASPLLRHD